MCFGQEPCLFLLLQCHPPCQLVIHSLLAFFFSRVWRYMKQPVWGHCIVVFNLIKEYSAREARTKAETIRSVI